MNKYPQRHYDFDDLQKLEQLEQCERFVDLHLSKMRQIILPIINQKFVLGCGHELDFRKLKQTIYSEHFDFIKKHYSKV
ncbi:MAG: hypothetical protein GY793_07315 [Proteobacteria bacterium]|nr:hypothetical protein [Pseudomonadota bacterium]